MILKWTHPARNDPIDILDYIADDNPSAALAVIERIEASARRLVDFPLSGREGSVPDTRELPIPGPALSYASVTLRLEAEVQEVMPPVSDTPKSTSRPPVSCSGGDWNPSLMWSCWSRFLQSTDRNYSPAFSRSGKSEA